MAKKWYGEYEDHVSSEIACRYNEERWTNRFKHQDASFPSLEETCEPFGQEERDATGANRGLMRLQYTANQLLAVAPTVILIGMYGAAAFAIFSFGAAWVGFLVAALLAACAAVGAFAAMPKKEFSN